MKVDLFDFDLPEDRIALRPAVPRHTSRLLRVLGDGWEHHHMIDLPDLLGADDLLVFNDTKVLPTRLSGIRHRAGDVSNAPIEVTLHKAAQSTTWWAFARPAKKIQTGDRLSFSADLAAEVRDKGARGEVLLDFGLERAELFLKLHEVGVLPLPPYIARKRAVDGRDLSDYQTVFAREEGAVAAPTAGLHFSMALLSALTERGIRHAYVTLHVGAGTFLPVFVDDTADHKMHAEYGVISREAAGLMRETKERGGKIVAVGTTSLRLLEAAAQADGVVDEFDGETDIFIEPGYRFRVVDILITNFHLPKSTLFMLVAAFSGLERMQQSYALAVNRGYRFYSYGDACLLTRSSDG